MSAGLRTLIPGVFSTFTKTVTQINLVQTKRLNGQLGMTAVLHTWGQNLSQHVHLKLPRVVTHPGEVKQLLGQLMRKDWVVYAKPCLHKAETVVQYLARYTRKIAISECLPPNPLASSARGHCPLCTHAANGRRQATGSHCPL